MNTVDYAHVIGLFREQDQAKEAVAALKQVGIAEDQIHLTHYQSVRPENTRVLVHVHAFGREQEAVNILTRHGANNADVPPGTALTHGDLVSRFPEAS